MRSIRRRLLLWLLAGLASILGVSGYATYRQARGEVNVLFDYQLQQMALALRSQNLLALAIAGDGAEGPVEGDIQVQIWDRISGLIYISQRQRELPFVRPVGFSEVNWQNLRWRVFSLQAGNRTVQVAQPLQVRLKMSADIALRNTAPFFLLLPGVALVIWFGVGAGLRPLTRIAGEIERRTPTALEPVSTRDLPTEVRPLIQALNDLLRRLSQALDAQRQFVADAAHELRTPLTAVRLQTEMVQRAQSQAERVEAITDLRAGLERASHLVDQLLAMARLDADTMTIPLEPVDLLELARTTVMEYLPLADARSIDLGLTPSEPVTVPGESENLRILLGNLVDNAIRYTPAGGAVDVAVSHADAVPTLSVTDTGPGIPPEDRERVFDRFYRGMDNKVPGSGLGLAIVRRIAERHGANLTLDAGEGGHGLKVTVRFPADEIETQK
ncbi:MAG: ATP-binding protein [Candidatus Competibacteraceae bacterium]